MNTRTVRKKSRTEHPISRRKKVIRDFLEDNLETEYFYWETMPGCCAFKVAADFDTITDDTFENLVAYDDELEKEYAIPPSTVRAFYKEKILQKLAECDVNSIATLTQRQQKFYEPLLKKAGFKCIVKGIYNPNTLNLVWVYLKIKEPRRSLGKSFDHSRYVVENGMTKTKPATLPANPFAKGNS